MKPPEDAGCIFFTSMATPCRWSMRPAVLAHWNLHPGHHAAMNNYRIFLQLIRSHPYKYH